MLTTHYTHMIDANIHSKANITFHSKKIQHSNRVVEVVVLSFNFHLFENEKTIEI